MFEFKSWDHFQSIFGSAIKEQWVFNPEPIKEYLTYIGDFYIQYSNN